MKIIFLFCAILILSFFSFQSVNGAETETISITTENNKLVISLNSIVKLKGGVPVFENAGFIPLTISQRNTKFDFSEDSKKATVIVKATDNDNVVGFYIQPNGINSAKGDDFTGLFFDSFPQFKQGVALWRYKPWNAWTKPMKISTPGQLEAWDVQFFYWQYADGSYGAAIPLSGNGYRTTLGSNKGRFGCKAISYFDTTNRDTIPIPMFAIGFGNDPYKLFEQLYQSGLKMMGKAENIRTKKTYPKPFEYLGWCTWNSSDMGKNLSDQYLLDAAKSFQDKKISLGFMIIDDGWSDNNPHQNSLKSFLPKTDKFPNGFKKTIETLKTDYGIRYVGAWHALNCYWAGVDKNSTVGKEFETSLFPWTQKNPVGNDPGNVTSMISPFAGGLAKFYDQWYTYLKSEGIDFVKVDNQLIVEQMSKGNFPIWDLAAAMHENLDVAVKKHFDGAIINCMDMTNDAFYNFGSTAVARTVEDYFPYEKGETFNLQKGNAPAHITQAVYNSLYFQQMVWPDYDMFESNNPNVNVHVVGRAISGGPVYLTDKSGEQNEKAIMSLIYSDGKVLRSDVPGKVTEDCLFNVQDARLLKVFSFANGAGLLAIINPADTNEVKGSFKVTVVKGLSGTAFIVYEHFTKTMQLIDRKQEIPVTLKKFGSSYYNIVAVENGVAIIGLIDKLNAPKAVSNIESTTSKVSFSLYEGGDVLIYCSRHPKSVFVNEKVFSDFHYENNRLNLNLKPENKTLKIEVVF
jgi:raffinose synthase